MELSEQCIPGKRKSIAPMSTSAKKSKVSSLVKSRNVYDSQSIYHEPDALELYGLCVIPLQGLSSYVEQEFDDSIRRQPEFNEFDDLELKTTPLVGGGFAALGNASSFHDIFPRHIRRLVYGTLKPYFDTKYPHLKKELIPDRMSQRATDQKPTAELYHRDMTPSDKTKPVASLPEDLIFGGWVNCNNNYSQHFECVPESHTFCPVEVKHGFHLLSKEEKKDAEKAQVIIEVPPGNMLVFNQTLVHRVHATKLNFIMKRVYIALRLTSATTTTPLIRDIRSKLKRGDVIPLKSGQIPVMFPRLWKVNWPDKWIQFSEKFPRYMKEKKSLHGKRLLAMGMSEGEYDVLKEIAPPSVPLEPYSEAELALYDPHF